MRTRAMLVRASQRMHGGESIPALADPLRKLRKRSSISSLQHRPLAWRDAEDDAKHWNMRFTHFLLLQPEAWLVTGYGSTAAWLHRHPFICAFQIGVSIERQFSRIFPAHPRSLASVLIPRPAARRVSASASPPCGFRLSENLVCNEHKRDFPNLPKKTPLGLGSWAHSRRFAQECPEGNPGKYNQGELTWHSTKTRSL